MIKIVPSKNNRIAWASIRRLQTEYKTGVRLGFEQAAASHQRTIKKELNDKEAKRGRLYLKRLEGRLVRHRASAAGQTAATFTGNYERLVGVKVNGADTMRFGDSAVYARFLEEGTSRMEPRPSLGNTVKKEYRNTQTYLGVSVYKRISRGST